MSTQTLNGLAINNYPVFEGSQVLTSEQLNDLFSYLDQQNRFTRSKLIGIGIVCGLHISTTSDSVVLSKGLGVTSDGFLIRMPDCTMKYRRSYQLPTGVFYEPFGNFDDDGVFSQDKDIVLHELLAKKPTENSFKEIDKDFFSDKYMLIYLECFDRDPRSCLGKNCEDLGKERIFTIRKLAVNQKGLIKILDKSNGSILNPYAVSSGLGHIDLPKPLFTNDNESCKNYEAFVKLYIAAITEETETVNVFDSLFGEGSGQGLLAQTYNKFQPLLGPVYNYSNPLSGNSRYSKVKSDLRKILNGTTEPTKYNIQSLYEYLSVLIKAYHEFVASAELLVSACGPENEFSLHLSLGKILFDLDKESDEIDILGESRFRHQFLQPRIFNEQANLERKVISLHKRIVLLLESFDLERLSDSELPVKITPTVTSRLLGESSIPYFLQPGLTGNTDGIRKTQLDREWNFELTISTRMENRVVSYDYNKLIAGESTMLPAGLIQTPLFFPSKDQAFRIAGSYRKDVDLVKKLISEQKAKFNLPFEILPVRFGGDTDHIIVDEHYWIDLQSDYKLVKSGIITTLRNLLGDLKVFRRIASEWEFDIPYANVYNFKVEIVFILDEIIKSLGLYEEGKRLLQSLPDTIEEMYNNGSPVISIPEYYKLYRRNLSKTYLRLEYASEILNWEKIEVLPHEIFLDWTRQINLLKVSIRDFLTNAEFFRLFNLYHRFVNRYQYLQKNHFSIFCNFLKQHPGIEATPTDRGGTHILLFDDSNGESEDRVVLADFNLPYRLTENEMHIPLDPELERIKLPPVARGEAVLIKQGESRLIDATANDLDPNGDSLKINRKGFTDSEGEFNSGKSFKGGDVIYHEGENSILRYEPNKFTTGSDFFEYTIENSTDNSLTDNVVVEIFITASYQKHVHAIDDLAATNNNHSVVIDLLLNDVSYRDTQVIIPELSEFGAGLTLLPDKKVRYNPVFGREGKDSFTYELEQVRNINDEEIIEKSVATVNVIVYCCDTVEFELICEGNSGEFDVLTQREKEESAELVLLDENGEATDELKLNHGSVKVIRDSNEPDDDSPENSTYLLYTPDIYFAGLEEFTYEVIDREGFIRRVRMHVMVVKCSETKLIRTLKDTIGFFSDIDKDARSVKLFSERSELKDDLQTINGKAKVERTDGGYRIVYEPNDGYYGLDMLQFAVQDEEGFWHYKNLNIIIDGYEKVRVESTFQDNPAVFKVLSDRMLEEGFSLKVYEEKSAPKDKINTSEGGVAIVSDGDIRYEPKTSFLGDDSFNYVILKDGLPFEYGRFYVILDTNRKVSVEYTRRGDSKDVYLLTEEQAEKEATLEIVSGPVVTGAKATVENVDGVSFIKYIPADGYVGQDNFDYIIELDDVKLFGTVYMVVDSNIRIEVTSVFKDDQTTVKLFDEELKVDKFEILTETANGTLVWNPERNTVTYKPNPDFTGHDKLHYKATFGDSTQYGTIFFLVICECKDIQVFGTVTDETERAIPDVRVQEVGTETFVLTGRSGVYSINASPNATLRFTKITHETEEIDVAYRTTVNAQLRRKRVEVSGVVQNESGKPIGGALIETELGKTTSNATGNFELVTYAASTMRFSASGYLEQNLFSANTNQQLTVTLQSAFVKVFITARDEKFGQILFGSKATEIGTDNSIFTELTTPFEVPQSAKIKVEAPGFTPKIIDVNELIFFNGEESLDFFLTPVLVRVSGTVTDEKGEPISSANINIDSSSVISTDASGKYSMEIMWWETFKASANGFKDSEVSHLIKRDSSPYLMIRDSKIAADDTAVIDFTLIPDVPSLAGLVMNEFNTPIEGAQVTSSRHTTYSDAQGNYEVIVNPGEPVKFKAEGYIDFDMSSAPPAGMRLNVRMNSIDRQRFVWSEENVFNETENHVGTCSFALENSIYIAFGREFNPNTQFKPALGQVLVYDTVSGKFTQKNDFPGQPRMDAVCFVINNHAYIGLGNDGLGNSFNDFWRYIPAENNWTEVSRFPGQIRNGAVGFSLGDTGYIGTGSDQADKTLNEFWAYNPAADQWVQKADFAGGARKDAACFTLNGIGYIATGRGATGIFSDLWAYNSKDDKWERKADIFGEARYGAFGFSLGEKGFIGAGIKGGTFLQDTTIYNPEKDEWEQSFNLPTAFAGGFGIGLGVNGFAGFGEKADYSSVIFKAQWKHWN